MARTRPRDWALLLNLAQPNLQSAITSVKQLPWDILLLDHKILSVDRSHMPSFPLFFFLLLLRAIRSIFVTNLVNRDVRWNCVAFQTRQV